MMLVLGPRCCCPVGLSVGLPTILSGERVGCAFTSGTGGARTYSHVSMMKKFIGRELDGDLLHGQVSKPMFASDIIMAQ